jgi:hypothetical protein
MNDGILITEGMTFSLAQLSITINKDTGEMISFAGGQPMLHYDVCPAWLSIGIEHLKEAEQARADMLAAKDARNDELRNRALERGFRGSMQAIMSSAIAIDALYAVVKSKLKPDAEPFDPEKRAPRRFAQVSEQLRQAFQLKPTEFAVVRDAIEQIFKFRDEAVHPTGNSTQPIVHPDLNVRVERRLVVFRYENALAIVQAAVRIISELAAKGAAKNAALEQYAKSLKLRLDPIRAEPMLGLPPFED